VIGTVVGIGGAIVLGALAAVAWRLWGRKKPVEDDFYDPNDTSKEARGSGSTEQNPFKTTLDQYHNPVPVNTAHNF